jgi:tetratricopeptide (TPR) repeat protein
MVEALNRTSTGLGQRIKSLPDGAQGDAMLLKLARSSLASRDAVRAADLAETLLARKDVSNGHQVLGDAWYIQGEQLKAVEQWHASLAADPKNANALMSLADFNSDRNNHAEAVEYLGQILATHPDDTAALFARGTALYELKRMKESEADLARALALKGDTGAPLALYYLGLIQKDKGNLQGAAEFLRRYLQWGYRQGRLTPVEADVHFALADIYKGLQLPDLADQQRKAGETLKQRLQQSAQSTREAIFDYLRKR